MPPFLPTCLVAVTAFQIFMGICWDVFIPLENMTWVNPFYLRCFQQLPELQDFSMN